MVAGWCVVPVWEMCRGCFAEDAWHAFPLLRVYGRFLRTRTAWGWEYLSVVLKDSIVCVRAQYDSIFGNPDSHWGRIVGMTQPAHARRQQACAQNGSHRRVCTHTCRVKSHIIIIPAARQMVWVKEARPFWIPTSLFDYIEELRGTRVGRTGGAQICVFTGATENGGDLQRCEKRSRK